MSKLPFAAIVAAMLILIDLDAWGGEVLYPNKYGLNKAKSGVERFEILRKVHVDAVKKNASVSYEGIKSIDIEIPKDAQPIPLNGTTDFCGVTFNVKNSQKSVYLFSLRNYPKALAITGKMIDGGDFDGVREFKENNGYLLIVQDDKPWVVQRAGHDYGHTRKDIFYVFGKKSVTCPVMPYNNPQSLPSATFCQVTPHEKSVGNVTLNRLPGSTYKTYFIRVDSQYNVRLHDITINTPDLGGMVGDAAIKVINSVRVKTDNIFINGTYSREDKYGYGISLDNVLDYVADGIVSKSNWGIYGTNNVNKAIIRNSHINRFDIHCYGRDITCENCEFVGKYNQFSSIFGKVIFRNCSFDNFIPYLNESSYDSYVPVDVYFYDCVFDINSSRNALISMSRVDTAVNERPELNAKCFPNLFVNNLVVRVPEGVSDFIIYNSRTDLAKGQLIDYMTNVHINGLAFEYESREQGIKVSLISRVTPFANEIHCMFENVDLFPNGYELDKNPVHDSANPYSISFNIDGVSPVPVLEFVKSRLNYNAAENSQYPISYSECVLGHVSYAKMNKSKLPYKRSYKSCVIVLNDVNSNQYYIDNYADYENCDFVGSSSLKQVGFWGKNNNVSFSDCKCENISLQFDSARLVKGRLIGNKWK